MTYEPPKNGFRTFLILWLSQAISVFGSVLTVFAVNIWLTQTLYPRPEQKALLAGALAAFDLAYVLPVILGAPLAGVWADRHDRRITMIVANLMNGLMGFMLMGLMAAQTLQLWLLVALGALSSLTSVFHSAAFDTSYAMLVSEEQLPRANGLMHTMWSLAGLLSPMLAAGIIALPSLARKGLIAGPWGGALTTIKDGAPLAVGIDAVTFLVAAFTLLFLTIPSPCPAGSSLEKLTKQNFWSDVTFGFRYITHRPPLLWLLGVFAAANFVAGFLNLLAMLILKFNLARDWTAHGFTYETALALFNFFCAAGGLASGAFISFWGGLRSKRFYGVIIPMIILALADTVMGLSPYFFLMVAMGFVGAAQIPLMNAHSQTIWQIQNQPEMQGRVFAVRRLIAQGSLPLSAALAGLLGGIFNPGLVLVILSGLLALFCGAQLFNSQLLLVEDKSALDTMATKFKPKGDPSL